MRPRTLALLVVLSTAAAAASVRADDSGGFVLRLGNDTTSVEHYQRTGNRTVVDQVGRAPRVLRRHYEYEYAGAAIRKFSMVVTPPGGTTPTQTIEATFGPDSMRMKITTGSAPPRDLVLAWPKDAMVLASSSPWSSYESAIQRLVASKADSLRIPMYFLGADAMNVLSLRRIGRDSVRVWNDHDDHYHAKIDAAGRVLGVTPISGTQQFSAQRVERIDLDAVAASFAAREQAGAGMGMLSPRDTVNATVAGAALWIDYGRPGKRGRAIFGQVVPYGEVWRTGANAATQFRTDKALDFGGIVVPAGFYTLWTLPTASGWQLIVNKETGQWGTAHKPEQDLVTIPMKVETLSSPVERFTLAVDPTDSGGTLRLEWDTTRATAAFTVRP
jgi:hypothetical protein